MKIKAAIVLASFLVGACASEPKEQTSNSPSKGSTRTLRDLKSSQIATPVGLLLASMDSNHDAVISREEMNADLNIFFDAADSNGNGALSPIEFGDWSEKFLGSRYTVPSQLNFDHDQNSSISLNEFQLTFDAISQRLDKDRDSNLARSELLFTISGSGFDQNAMRREMEAKMRQKIREMCRSGRRR